MLLLLNELCLATSGVVGVGCCMEKREDRNEPLRSEEEAGLLAVWLLLLLLDMILFFLWSDVAAGWGVETKKEKLKFIWRSG